MERLSLAPVKISVTIITFNEEDHLDRCLTSVHGLADEIIVVDSGSLDRTLEIAGVHGAKIFTRPWSNYSEQKNYAASMASHEWILSLDADECLSQELKQEISELMKTGAAADAYQFPRMAFYLGRWIKHSGWYPDYKTRLYRKTKAAWQGRYVHETLQVNGSMGKLKGNLLHYTCDSISEHLARLDRYTSLAAEDLHSNGKSGNLFQLFFSPWLTFVRTFLLKSGYRDGFQGYLIACFAGFYNFMKYAKLRVLARHSPADRPTGART